MLGICFSVCFVTGLLSHYQYAPWAWLPEPASPVWLYRVTQGAHVVTGTATIPLLLVKLWSVYPNLFRWPTIRGRKHALERLSVFVLVSTALLQLFTGFLNALNCYPWPWNFVVVHFALSFVVIGSILLHIGVKLPDIRYGLEAKLADADVLTETPWSDNPDAHSNAGDVPPPATPALTRRGLLLATGAGVGAVVVTSIRQTVTPLEPLGLLAIREWTKGPQRVPVNKTAEQAGVLTTAQSSDWQLEVAGRQSYAWGLAEIEPLAQRGGLPDHLRRRVERGCALARHTAPRPRDPQWWRRSVAGDRVLARGQRGLQQQRRVRAAGLCRPARHPPLRRAVGHRPRLPVAAHLSQPARGAEHQVAAPHRGELRCGHGASALA